MDSQVETKAVGEDITADEFLRQVEKTTVVIYEVLSPTNLPEARAIFLSDDTIVTPRFEYGKIDEEKTIQILPHFIEENIDDPELLDHLFLSGKTDITDKDQERLIYEKKVDSV